MLFGFSALGACGRRTLTAGAVKGARDAEAQDLSESDGETQGGVAALDAAAAGDDATAAGVDGATGGHDALGEAGNRVPVANAGADQSVLRNQTVTLNGSASFDPDGDALTYTWRQIAGATVILTSVNSAQPRLVAPGAGDVLTFSLVVSDGQTSSLPSSTSITVSATGPSGGLQGQFAQHPFQASYTMLGQSRRVRAAGHLAYVATEYGLNIVDVSDPSAPSLAGFYSMTGGVSDVQIVGNLAYVAAGSSDQTSSPGHLGFQVLDVSNPAAPILVGSCDTPEYPVSLQVVGNLAFLADFDFGLLVVDISNPASPTLIGSYDPPGRALGVYVVGTIAYLSGAGLQVIDVSNPSTPVPIGSCDTPGIGVGVQVVGSFAFIATYDSLQVVDVSTPASPTLIGSYDPASTGLRYSTRSQSAYDVQVVGSYAFLAAGSAGLVVVDVSNPSLPTLAGTYTVTSNATGVYVVENYAFVVDDSGAHTSTSLEVIDVSSPSLPIWSGSALMDGYAFARDVQVVGNHAFLADADRFGLRIIDVSDPALPTLVGSGDGDGANCVQVLGNLAFLGAKINGLGSSGLQVLDVSDLASPTLVGVYALPDLALGVQVVGKLAFAADGGAGLQVIDVSDPTSPRWVGAFNATSDSRDVKVLGNYAFVLGDDSMQVIDVSNPAAPKMVGSYGTPIRTEGMDVVGNFAYVKDYYGLHVVDVSNPAAPTLLGFCATSGRGLGAGPDPGISVSVEGNFAYVAAGDRGLQVIDVSNPASPSLTGGYQTPDARRVRVVGDLAYVADGYSGLQIFELLSLNLAPDLEHAPAGSTQTYTVSWPAGATAPMVKCQVTGGSCAVTPVNLATRQATVQWTLPSTPGAHSLSVTVGNWNYFISARDDVEVQ